MQTVTIDEAHSALYLADFDQRLQKMAERAAPAARLESSGSDTTLKTKFTAAAFAARLYAQGLRAHIID